MVTFVLVVLLIWTVALAFWVWRGHTELEELREVLIRHKEDSNQAWELNAMTLRDFASLVVEKHEKTYHTPKAQTPAPDAKPSAPKRGSRRKPVTSG